MSSLLMLTLFYYTATPVADMREKPEVKAKIVSQSYLSEEVKVLAEELPFVKIETTLDHYQGWALKQTLCARMTPFISNARVTRAQAHLYDQEDVIYGPILTLPFDCKLAIQESKDNPNSRWLKALLVDGREGYIQRGDISFNTIPLTRDQMCIFSLQFLGLPYTWGGRSSFGYDCSGFVQMLYREMGIYLPRDSKDQINFKGFKVTSFDSLLPGDLIFFGLTEDKIRHVGVYLGNNQFIHTSVAENLPYLRLSQLNDAEWNGSSTYSYRAARTLTESKL